ncbi:hypothetical protein BGZ46_007576 [Entomortierella lignicola]|nr:hypothetical protein BGZ46_007576 [Entomortierella lignicola]
MSFPKDKKDVPHESFDHEEEQKTFGQQQPYATPTLTAQELDPTTTASTSTSALPSALPSAPSPNVSPVSHHVSPSAPQTQPQSQNEHSYNPQEGHVSTDVPPPAYEEVAHPRAPQFEYQPDVDDNSTSNPSAPLLGQAPATEYSTIPIPQAASTRASSSMSSDSQRSRGSSCFWLFFFLVVLLLIVDNITQGGDDEGCRDEDLMTRNLTDRLLASDYTDFSVIMSNMPSYIIVDQEKEDQNQGLIRFIVEASSSEREDLQTIRQDIKLDKYDRSVKASILRAADKEEPECMKTTVKIIFPLSTKRVRRLKLMVNEGNITVNLLDPTDTITQVDRLESTVITGHNYIRADVASLAKFGGTVGTLKGEIKVRKELTVTVVDGDVALNLIPDSSSTVSSKITTNNGNIDIGLHEDYEGAFKLSTTAGYVDVLNTDPLRTHISTRSETVIKGWHTLQGKEPLSPSELTLTTMKGRASLSLKPINIIAY